MARLAIEGYEVPELPVAWIEARDKKEARQKILLCNSSYGTMTSESLDAFLKESDFDLQMLKSEMALSVDVASLIEKQTVLKKLTIKEPPKMAWVLIGIPIQHFSKVQPLLDQLPPGAQTHTTANDHEANTN